MANSDAWIHVSLVHALLQPLTPGLKLIALDSSYQQSNKVRFAKRRPCVARYHIDGQHKQLEPRHRNSPSWQIAMPGFTSHLFMRFYNHLLPGSNLLPSTSRISNQTKFILPNAGRAWLVTTLTTGALTCCFQTQQSIMRVRRSQRF